MITYDYECRRCGRTFSVEQKITDKPLIRCRRKGCSGEVRRLISSSTTFVLKGKGWAKDGYR